MENLLVTGASGFVGRAVVAQALKEGKLVTGLGRNRPELDIAFIECDLTDATRLESALADKSFTRILHLASLPGDTGDPQQMVRVNVNGCLNMLECARKMKVRRFVLASSISAYEWYPGTKFNPPDYMPVDENHPCRPKDIYSTTKRMQELLVQTYHHQYQLPTAVLRLTAIVGPQGRGGGRGWREFAEKLDEGKRVQIPHLSANELCHYVDIRDVARMFLVAADHPQAVGEIFNCCGSSPTRGTEFIQIVQNIVPGIEVEVGFPWSMAQGREIAFDMSKAKRLLGFEPTYTLADGVQSIKDWIDADGLKGEARAQEDRAYGAGVERIS
jgi:nucleoside-diphosphate-sugar epimerase